MDTAVLDDGDQVEASGGWAQLPAGAKLAIRLGIVAVVLIAGFTYWLVAVHGRVTLDGTRLDSSIQTWLEQHGEPSTAVVTCPDHPKGKAGYVFICDVTGSSDVSGMRVTIDNDRGDVEWVAIPS
jgi:hypothetical protein